MNRSNGGLLLSAATSLYSMPLAAVELAGQVNIEHRLGYPNDRKV